MHSSPSGRRAERGGGEEEAEAISRDMRSMLASRGRPTLSIPPPREAHADEGGGGERWGGVILVTGLRCSQPE